MDACYGVEREVEKVNKKYRSIQDHLHPSLDELIENISGAHQELIQGTTKFRFVISNYVKEIFDNGNYLSTFCQVESNVSDLW